MNLLENIRLALSSLRSNLLRAILTLLIIAFGIMALVGILTAIDAMLFTMSDSFSTLGANTFSIEPASTEIRHTEGGRQEKVGEPISLNQAIHFKERFNYPGYVSINVQATGSATVSQGDTETNPTTTIIGVSDNYLITSARNIQQGRFFSSTELKYGMNKAILGAEIVENLFGGDDQKALGQLISVGNVRYKVIGTLASKGASMNANYDRAILIPLLQAKQVYGTANTNYTLSVSVEQAEQMEEAISEATGLMRSVRRLSLAEKNDFDFRKNDSLLGILKENTTNLRLATIAIGLMTLLGAAIGLMNIMLVSVTERTREIGLRKAVGATRQDILIQFLVEAVVICLIGGIAGVALGIFAGNVVSIFTGGSFIIPWSWMLLGIGICVITGLLSGLYPAIKAARLDPIESLRYEG